MQSQDKLELSFKDTLTTSIQQIYYNFKSLDPNWFTKVYAAMGVSKWVGVFGRTALAVYGKAEKN